MKVLILSLLLLSSCTFPTSLTKNSFENWQEASFKEKSKVVFYKDFVEIEKSDDYSGIIYKNFALRDNYEIVYKAKRVDGDNSFGSVTFPVKDSFVTLILGGWLNTVVGLSLVNDQDASDNISTQIFSFDNNEYYKIRIKVKNNKVIVSIDGDKLINLDITKNKFSLQQELANQIPLSFNAISSKMMIKDIYVYDYN